MGLLAALICLVMPTAKARDVGIVEVLDLPPMPVSKILDHYVEKNEDGPGAGEVVSESSKNPSHEASVVRKGADYQLADLLAQEPVPYGAWLKSLGRMNAPSEQGIVIKVAAQEEGESTQAQMDPSQKVLIRVQGEGKQTVTSQLLDVDHPAATDEQIEVYAQRDDNRAFPTYKQDATSDFLSSYLSNIKDLNDSLALSPEAGAGKLISIKLEDGNVSIEPNTIAGAVGDIFEISIDRKELIDEAKLVVRNQELLSWQPETMELKAEKKGRSEVILSLRDQMLFIPVEIGTQEKDNLLLADLYPPAGMVGFNSLGVLSAKQFSLNGKMSEGLNPKISKHDILPFTPFEQEDGGWKIKQSIVRSPYFVDRMPVTYDKIRLQLIDEQSILEKKEIRPAAGVELKIIGTQYSEVSNAKGMGSFINVPHQSRFFVETSDTSHYYAPSIVEVHSQEEVSGEPIRIKLMQKSLLHHLRAIHGVVPSPFQASLCGVAVGHDNKPLAGVHAFARYDAYSGSEAIYFSETGLPGEARQTGPDGRFCFLALDEGPLGVEFSQGREYIGSIPVNVFAGKHLDLTFPIFNQHELKTRIAALPHAKDIDLLPPNDSDRRSMVDMANLVAISDESLFQQIDFGYVGAVEPQNYYNGRSCYVNESPEFEYAYYCHDQGQDEHVTSLIPNGFMSTVFQKYNMPFMITDFGSVLVEHGAMQGREHDTELVVIELVDSFGNQIENQVHISDKPTTRAVFYNLKPGAYTVITKTSQGYWLDMDTVRVYSDTTSYLRTGSPVRFNAASVLHEGDDR